MAESISEREDSDGCEVNTEETEEGSQNFFQNARDVPECAVCLQLCIHPVKLPCGHIFCYLCVKGVANQSKRCAMCRHELPPDFLDHPQLVHKDDLSEVTSFDDGQQWFYEGHNGWWQYDERTSWELETAHARGDKTCELLIAGFLYVVDFENMVQMRRNDPSRRRRVKRDAATIPKKGIAGLRIPSSDNRGRELADGQEVMGDAPTNLAMHVARSLDRSSLPSTQSLHDRQKRSSPTLVPPNNTPQTPHTPSTSSARSSPDVMLSELSLNQAMQGLQNLDLEGNNVSLVDDLTTLRTTDNANRANETH